MRGIPRAFVRARFIIREATQAVFNGESPKGFPSNLLKVARRKLRYLNAAAELGDLRALPGNRLEALKGPRPVSTRSGRADRGRDHGLPLRRQSAMIKKLAPMHPGEVLREEFLVLLKLSAGALARKMVSRARASSASRWGRPVSLPMPRCG